MYIAVGWFYDSYIIDVGDKHLKYCASLAPNQTDDQQVVEFISKMNSNLTTWSNLQIASQPPSLLRPVLTQLESCLSNFYEFDTYNITPWNVQDYFPQTYEEYLALREATFSDPLRSLLYHFLAARSPEGFEILEECALRAAFEARTVEAELLEKMEEEITFSNIDTSNTFAV